MIANYLNRKMKTKKEKGKKTLKNRVLGHGPAQMGALGERGMRATAPPTAPRAI